MYASEFALLSISAKIETCVMVYRTLPDFAHANV